MPFAQDVTSKTTANSTGDVLNPSHKDGSFKRGPTGTGAGDIIAVLGHDKFTLETVQAGATSAGTCTLEGSNDGVNWKTLGTNAHAGNDAKFVEVTDKPYRFVRVNKTVDVGAGDTMDYFLRCAGASGIY